MRVVLILNYSINTQVLIFSLTYNVSPWVSNPLKNRKNFKIILYREEMREDSEGGWQSLKCTDTLTFSAGNCD